MKRLGLGGLVLVVLLAGVAGLAGHAALAAAEDLERARTRLLVAQQEGTTTDEALTALRRAREDIDQASAELDRWPVDLVAAVPVLGRSWQAERAVTRTAHAVVEGAVVLGDRLPGVRASAGGIHLADLAATRGALAGPAADSRSALRDLRGSQLGLTPPQVSRGVSGALAALGPAVRTLQRAEQGLELVAGLLGGGGPRSVLVVLQNNAELRGAGGYAATFATGRTDDGRITLGPLRDVYEVADPPDRARRVPAPAEYVEDFGALSADTTVWRSWNMSPHVPDSALVGARVAGQLLPEDDPDVVVLLDVPALGALAGLGGDGVALPDGSLVAAEDLTEALLVDAYAEAGADTGVQADRRSALRAAATAAVGRLLTGGISAADAARTLGDLAAGRHVAVWSARQEEQEALVRLGLAGAVEPAPGGDLAHVSVNNVGANKLDYYVDRQLTVEVEVGPETARVLQRVSFTNGAPEGLVPYVAGYERPGVVVSLVELSLPPDAEGIVATVDGRPWPGDLHTGGLRQRLSTRMELPRDATSVVEVRYEVPVAEDRYALRLVPQPLVRDAGLRLSVAPADGERLVRAEGAELQRGRVSETGPFRSDREVVVHLHRDPPSLRQRFQRWWNSPVTLG